MIQIPEQNKITGIQIITTKNGARMILVKLGDSEKYDYFAFPSIAEPFLKSLTFPTPKE